MTTDEIISKIRRDINSYRKVVAGQKAFLGEIGQRVNKLVSNGPKREVFKEQLKAFRRARIKFESALNEARAAAKTDAGLLYNCAQRKEEAKPPKKGYELEELYVLDTGPKAYWRPPLPFDPDGYLMRFRCKLFGLFRRDDEPKDNEQKFMCECALLAAIRDMALDKPTCDRLTDSDRDNWVEELWVNVNSAGATADDLADCGDRRTMIQTALQDVEAEEEPEQEKIHLHELSFEQQQIIRAIGKLRLLQKIAYRRAAGEGKERPSGYWKEKHFQPLEKMGILQHVSHRDGYRLNKAYYYLLKELNSKRT